MLMGRIAKRMLLFVVAILMLAMMPAPVSAASAVKISSVSGVVAKMADGSTGYLVAKKNLKKGASLTLKKVSATSKVAKTYAYGKSKNWSAKKLAKALKKPKAYKATLPSTVTIFKAYKGKKLTYVVAKVTSKTPPKPAPAPTPAPAADPQQPETDVQSQNVQDQPSVTAPETGAVSTEPVAPTEAESAELTVKVVSSDAKYNSSLYCISGMQLTLRDNDNNYVAMTLSGSATSASASAVVPEGTYDITFRRSAQTLSDGAEPYYYPEGESVTVSGDTVKNIVIEPVAGQLGINVSDATAAANDLVVKVDNKPVSVPCTLELTAGEDHHVQVIADGQTIYSEPVYVKPGWSDIEI